MKITDADPTEVHTEHASPLYWATLWFLEAPDQWFAKTVVIEDANDVEEVLAYVAGSGATRCVISVVIPGNPHARIVLAGEDPV